MHDFQWSWELLDDSQDLMLCFAPHKVNECVYMCRHQLLPSYSFSDVFGSFAILMLSKWPPCVCSHNLFNLFSFILSWHHWNYCAHLLYSVQYLDSLSARNSWKIDKWEKKLLFPRRLSKATNKWNEKLWMLQRYLVFTLLSTLKEQTVRLCNP